MINTAEVMLWGTRIGIIHMNEANGVVAFEYDKDFLKSNIEVSPIHMPLSERVYEFPELARTAFHGAPGLVADSLPDKFGNKIIDRWLAEQGKSISEFNVIDRLCYTGKRGMGALEYIPATSPFDSTIEDVNISKRPPSVSVRRGSTPCGRRNPSCCRSRRRNRLRRRIRKRRRPFRRRIRAARS